MLIQDQAQMPDPGHEAAIHIRSRLRAEHKVVFKPSRRRPLARYEAVRNREENVKSKSKGGSFSSCFE
jgi:hypothetical protein